LRRFIPPSPAHGFDMMSSVDINQKTEHFCQ
jgi:hypothetical protein